MHIRCTLKRSGGGGAHRIRFDVGTFVIKAAIGATTTVVVARETPPLSPLPPPLPLTASPAIAAASPSTTGQPAMASASANGIAI